MNKYLISTVVRDDSTFWVDVADNSQADTLWNIVPYTKGGSLFADRFRNGFADVEIWILEERNGDWAKLSITIIKFCVPS